MVSSMSTPPMPLEAEGGSINCIKSLSDDTIVTFHPAATAALV